LNYILKLFFLSLDIKELLLNNFIQNKKSADI